jgi:hypothetical protein
MSEFGPFTLLAPHSVDIVRKEIEENVFFPTSSLKMTFPSLNLEMKVGVFASHVRKVNHFPH